MTEIPEDNPFSKMFYEGMPEAMRMGNGFIDVEVVKQAISYLPIARFAHIHDSECAYNPLEKMGLMSLRAMAWANGLKTAHQQHESTEPSELNFMGVASGWKG
jgi:hypothetical protein